MTFKTMKEIINTNNISIGMLQDYIITAQALHDNEVSRLSKLVYNLTKNENRLKSEVSALKEQLEKYKSHNAVEEWG